MNIINDDNHIDPAGMVSENLWFVFHLLDVLGEWLKERPGSRNIFEKGTAVNLCKYVAYLKVTKTSK